MDFGKGVPLDFEESGKPCTQAFLTLVIDPDKQHGLSLQPFPRSRLTSLDADTSRGLQNKGSPYVSQNAPNPFLSRLPKGDGARFLGSRLQACIAARHASGPGSIPPVRSERACLANPLESL